MKKRIGLMGCGQVAAYGHIPAILGAEGLELHALYDVSEQNVRGLQQRYNVPVATTSLEDFFKSGIEAVTITSPAPCHKQNVLDCARHGLSALCEKPLAMNKEEGDLMVKAMKEAVLPLYSGFCYRFSPAALKIRELVRDGSVGEVKSLRLIYNWNMHGKYEKSADGASIIQKRRELRMHEGGPMVDCGTHQIDLALFWLGSPVIRSSGHGAWVDDYEAPDHMWLHLDHANGAHTVVEISYSYTHTSLNPRFEFVYELIGTKGLIRYDRATKSFLMENGEGRRDFEFSEEKDFTGMYREWSRALQKGSSEMLTTAEQGLVVADIARSATNQAIAARPAPL